MYSTASGPRRTRNCCDGYRLDSGSFRGGDGETNGAASFTQCRDIGNQEGHLRGQSKETCGNIRARGVYSLSGTVSMKFYSTC